MQLSFHTLDVFTKHRFGGNPLAVVLGADAGSKAKKAAERSRKSSSLTHLMYPISLIRQMKKEMRT